MTVKAGVGDEPGGSYKRGLRRPPLKIEPMSFGHTNQVYSVTLSDEQIILRTNDKPGVLEHTADNIAILSSLGLPVPRVIRTDVSMEQVPFAYMILEHFPGRDLRYELEGMTHEQMTELAQQIISYQRACQSFPRHRIRMGSNRRAGALLILDTDHRS